MKHLKSFSKLNESKKEVSKIEELTPKFIWKKLTDENKEILLKVKIGSNEFGEWLTYATAAEKLGLTKVNFEFNKTNNLTQMVTMLKHFLLIHYLSKDNLLP